MGLPDDPATLPLYLTGEAPAFLDLCPGPRATGGGRAQ